MSDNTQKAYDILQDIFKNVWEQQKYAELKNGIILTLNIAILVVITRIYSTTLSCEILNNVYSKWAFYGLMMLFILHIVGILQSYFPKDTNQEACKCTNDEINIFFFGDISTVNSDIYLRIVLKKLNSEIDIEKEILLDLSNQIVKLSEITQRKYTSFKSSIYRMYILGILFLIYFTYLYVL